MSHKRKRDIYDFPSASPSPPPRPPPPSTTWEAVLRAYPEVAAAFPSQPANPEIEYLAGLPAKEGALTPNAVDKGKGKKKQKVEREFKLGSVSSRRNQNVKAALAQATGIPAQVPCDNCAAGNGIWAACGQAPTREGAREDVFRGSCPSCFYNSKAACCKRTRAAAAPPQPSMEDRIGRYMAMTDGEFGEEKRALEEAERRRAAAAAAAAAETPRLRSFSEFSRDDRRERGGFVGFEDEDEDVDMDEMSSIAENPWG